MMASKFFPENVLETAAFGFGDDGETSVVVGVEGDLVFSKMEIRSDMGRLLILLIRDAISITY